jgi:hypothetical protein
MPILPSTLEYSTIAFQQKLDYIHIHTKEFMNLGNQEVMEFHIDLVYPEFAKSRSVMSSINLTDNYNCIIGLKSKCKVTVHFMGLLDDVSNLNKELKKLKLIKNIEFELYLPTNIHPKMIESDCVKYHWFDVDQYDLIPKYGTPKILLMTVFAGKSGQVLTLENKQKALDIVKSRGVENVIVDGGWTIEECIDGLRMVSYSSFWKKYLSL